MQINDALHAYLPFLPAVKSSQPRILITCRSYGTTKVRINFHIIILIRQIYALSRSVFARRAILSLPKPMCRDSLIFKSSTITFDISLLRPVRRDSLIFKSPTITFNIFLLRPVRRNSLIFKSLTITFDISLLRPVRRGSSITGDKQFPCMKPSVSTDKTLSTDTVKQSVSLCGTLCSAGANSLFHSTRTVCFPTVKQTVLTYANSLFHHIRTFCFTVQNSLFQPLEHFVLPGETLCSSLCNRKQSAVWTITTRSPDNFTPLCF